MQRTSFLFSLLSLTCLLLGSCSSSAPSSPNQVKIGVLCCLDSFPLFVAQQEGFFSELAIQVELVPFQSAIERDACFQAGELDGITSDLVGTALMQESGSDVRIALLTMGRDLGVGRVAILAAPQSPITKIQELKGRVLALSHNTVIEYIADGLLHSQGLSPQQLTKVQVSKIPLRLNMLLEGQVDAAILPDPLAAYGESRGARLLCDDKQQNLGQSVLTFHKGALDNKLSTLKKFMKAYNRACTKLAESPQQFRSLFTEVTRMPKELCANYEIPMYPQNTLPSQKHIEKVCHWLQGKGYSMEASAYEEWVTDQLLPTGDS